MTLKCALILKFFNESENMNNLNVINSCLYKIHFVLKLICMKKCNKLYKLTIISEIVSLNE